MTADRFDEFTRRLGAATSRRGLLKGGLALALGGVATRLRGDSVDARARVKMACARLGQACATGTGTPGNMLCCPDLTCGGDAVCCKDANQTCVSNDDCCGDNTCRPNPTGLGNRCLPAGAVGAECVEDSDCAAGLACEATTGQCGETCGVDVCRPDQFCDGYTLLCVGDLGAPCVAGSECASGFCDSYVGVCVGVCPTEVIYDSTIQPLPSSVTSLGFQTSGTAEFGDYIAFVGTNRTADAVVVSMNTWAPQSDWPLITDPNGWTHPITLNIYAADTSGANPAPGALLGTVTQTFNIPWRPAADPTCVAPASWRNPADNTCYTGFLFDIAFDLSGLNLTLPDAVIVSVAYNTQTYGAAPLGADGPYNSLNIGLRDTTIYGAVPTGTDVETDALYWNTTVAGFYTDLGAGGTGTFRRDTNWTPDALLVQFVASC